MCGLVGAAGDIRYDEKVAFRHLLFLDHMRGPHSTGVATAIRKTNNVHLYRSIGHPFNIFEDKKFSEQQNGIYSGDPKMMMGHNRFATVGKIVPSNAHPFRHGDIVGAHNGTLDQLGINNLDNVDDFEVDSEAIIFNINKNGFENTIDRLHGAWALTWYDKKLETLHFIRNDQRPLFYRLSSDKKTIFWGSEEWMLSVALQKSKIFNPSEAKLFETNRLYTIGLDGLNKLEIDISKKEYKGFTPPPPKIHHVVSQGNMKSGGMSHRTSSSTNPFTSHANTDSDKLMSNIKEKEYQYLQNNIGSEVSFYFATYQDNDEYLSGWPMYIGPNSQYFNIPIRVYINSKNANYKEWKTGGVQKTYKANLKQAKVSADGHYYILLDMRTIKLEEKRNKVVSIMERFKASVDKLETTKGFIGQEMSKDEFIKKTCNGCAYCSADISWEDRDNILWATNDDAIGACCSSNKERLNELYTLYGIK